MAENPNLSVALANALSQAQSRSLLATLEAALHELGVQTIEGKSVSEFYHARIGQELETILLAMEKVDPGAAAALQQHLDAIKMKVKPPE